MSVESINSRRNKSQINQELLILENRKAEIICILVVYALIRILFASVNTLLFREYHLIGFKFFFPAFHHSDQCVLIASKPSSR